MKKLTMALMVLALGLVACTKKEEAPVAPPAAEAPAAEAPAAEASPAPAAAH